MCSESPCRDLARDYIQEHHIRLGRKGIEMKNLLFTTSMGIPVTVLILLFQVVSFAAQDHNSSRSNKTASIAAPDSGTDAGESGFKVKEKANRTKSLSTDGDTAGFAINEPGIGKGKGGKGNATRKAFVLPHVLEKSGSATAAPCDSSTADCGPAPQDHAITEKGLPGGPVKGSK